MSNVRKTRRTRALVEMVRTNTVIKCIQLYDRDRDSTIFLDEIQPRLDINKHRPRIDAVRKAEPLLRVPLMMEELVSESVNRDLSLAYLFVEKIRNCSLDTFVFCQNRRIGNTLY